MGFASNADAQGRDTGVMVVHAMGPDGGPLPGVMVVSRGPVGRQTQYTGVDGSARFPGLYPGEGYSATFTLNGFTTVIREGLIVSAGRVIDFSVALALATVEETIMVTGESPLVNVKSTGLAGMITADLIDKTPTASGLWAGVMDKVPGVVSSFDVGGGDSGQQSVNTAWGSEWRNNTYSINGGDATDPVEVGGAASYFSVGSFEEVSVSMAAQDIEIKTAGLNINMVVKSGSNDWRAGVKYFYEGESMVSSNVDAELEAVGISEGTPNVLLSDLDIQGGGPIIRDRAWVFIDWWDFEIQKLVLNLDEVDITRLRDLTLNLNGQIDDNNKISGRWLHSYKYRNNRGARQSRPYLGRIQDSYSDIPQLQWQSVINQNIFADVRFSTLRANFPLVRRWEPGGSEPLAVPASTSATYDFAIGDYVARPSLPTSEFLDERDSDALAGTVSWYITGENTSQDLKFGGEYRWINYLTPTNYPLGYRRYVRSSRVGSARYDPNNNPNWADGVPVEIRLYNTPIAAEDGGSMDCFVLSSCWKPDNARNQQGRAMSLFLQDTITIANRWTIAAGVRWDRAYNWNPSQNRLDSPWCGQTTGLNNPGIFCGGNFPEQDVAFVWSDVTPRIGVIWDVTGDGTWALKANFARYSEALGVNYGAVTNVNNVAREDWDWFDPNGDGLFQFGEQTGFRSSFYPGEGTVVDPDLQAPSTDEFIAGLEHEIFDNILLSVTGIFRGRRDDVGTVNIGRPYGPMLTNERCLAECTPSPEYADFSDPWVELETVDPGDDGIIGTADDGGPVPIWAVDPVTRGNNNFLTTNPNTWGFRDNTYYRGVSFVVSKRWSNNWQILASWDIGRAETEGSSTTPNGLYGRRRQWTGASLANIIKVTANYLIAEPIGVNFGLFVRAQNGEPMFAQYTYDDSVIEPPNGPFPRQGNTNIVVMGRGEGDVQCPGCERPLREPFVTIVDIRAEKQVTVGRFGVLHFYFDVFNLFNANTITELNERLGRNWLRIDDILPPRVIRIGGAWDF